MFSVFNTTVDCNVYVQVSGHFAASFQPRGTLPIVRTAVRKGITRRPNRTQKKSEPGDCHVLLTTDCNANNKIPVNVVHTPVCEL